MTWQTVSGNSAASEQLGAKIGARLKGGEVIELASDLGGGKTTFARGLADGAGSTDQVSSPTFTLRNEYQAGGLTIYHFDFYRLNEAGIMTDELAEVIDDDKAVVVIEWSEIVHEVLPEQRLTVRITATGENDREINFNYPEAYNYLIKNLE